MGFLCKVIALFATVLIAVVPTFAVPPKFTTLQPGQFREINQNLQINIVFVGYHQGSGPRDINEVLFRSGLPHRYRTLDYTPSTYIPNLNESNAPWIGNSFDYNYNIVYADQAFEDAYFGFIASEAASAPCPITEYQDYYNTQHTRTLTVTDNLCVEANVAEYWLASNAPSMLGVDTSKYTVFLVNWYGRPDFRIHVYTPFFYIDPDPDTGFPWAYTTSRATIAWGGTTPDDQQNGFGFLSRIWFYDISAGPEWNTSNFVQDPDDPTFAGIPLSLFHSIPPVWEYGNTSAYRPFNDLSGDLAKVVRYAAIDYQFTKSAVLPPALSPPKMPQSIELKINLFNDDPPTNPRDFLKPDRLVAEEAALRPYNTFSVSVTDQNFAGRILDIYRCSRPTTFGIETPSCYGHRPVGGEPDFKDMFLYLRDHRLQYVDGDADYEVPVMAFFVPDDLSLGFGGFADDNHTDGKQSSFCYVVSPTHTHWFGRTYTSMHEIGHHLGMTHPHDGYDYEDHAYRFANMLEIYYSWAGDSTDPVMSYMNLANNFSQFDRDNSNRYMTAIYINQSNTILPRILASPSANQVNGLLASADADATLALVRYNAMDYLAAAVNAKSAYDKVLAAAAQINIRIEPNGSPSELRSHRPNPGLIDPPPGRSHLLSPGSENDLNLRFR